MRFALDVLRVWRGITFRQWAWTTGIALVLILAYAIGLFVPLLSMVPNMRGAQPPVLTAGQSIGMVISGLVAAYCFLLALSVAERDGPRSRGRAWPYVVAGCAAIGVAVLIENAMYLVVPSFVWSTAGWSPETKHVIGGAVWSAANLGLSGGLALAVYVRFQSARLAREAFNSAELERVGATREVLASRLAVMQAQIEPQFLLGALAQVEALYEHHPQAGNRMLDGLIAYLRAALPQLRSARSTLVRELQLAESYLRIVQLRMGSRLAYTVGVAPNLGETAFPPMLLLPLIDDALRNGLEPLPHGGTIIVAAEAVGDRVRVVVMHDGVIPPAPPNQSQLLATLRERLEGLYGPSARITSSSYITQGLQVAIELPSEAARAHR